jgi:hypothetical protein
MFTHVDVVDSSFSDPFPCDLLGTINGHDHAFVAWALMAGGSLFYEIKGNGRVIVPGEVRFYNQRDNNGR